MRPPNLATPTWQPPTLINKLRWATHSSERARQTLRFAQLSGAQTLPSGTDPLLRFLHPKQPWVVLSDSRRSGRGSKRDRLFNGPVAGFGQRLWLSEVASLQVGHAPATPSATGARKSEGRARQKPAEPGEPKAEPKPSAKIYCLAMEKNGTLCSLPGMGNQVEQKGKANCNWATRRVSTRPKRSV